MPKDTEMPNPSLIWTQLAGLNAPAGALPFVALDNQTINIDPLNFLYTFIGATISGTLLASQLTVLNGLRIGYSDTTVAPGNTVINKVAGRIKIAAGQSAAVITNSCCFLSSIINLNIEGAFDATATRAQVTAQAAGSFTITLNAAATAAVVVSFTVSNVF